jgi:hypothetical protein
MAFESGPISVVQQATVQLRDVKTKCTVNLSRSQSLHKVVLTVNSYGI